MKRTESFVEFEFPAILYAETTTRAVSSRDPKDVAAPVGAYAFRFYDVAVTGATRDDGQRIEIRDAPANWSPRHFVRGRVYTLPEVKALGKGYEILASNMECNDWPRVVRTHRGNWVSLGPGDVLLADLDGKAL